MPQNQQRRGRNHAEHRRHPGGFGIGRPRLRCSTHFGIPHVHARISRFAKKRLQGPPPPFDHKKTARLQDSPCGAQDTWRAFQQQLLAAGGLPTDRLQIFIMRTLAKPRKLPLLRSYISRKITQPRGSSCVPGQTATVARAHTHTHETDSDSAILYNPTTYTSYHIPFVPPGRMGTTFSSDVLLSCAPFQRCFQSSCSKSPHRATAQCFRKLAPPP